jgi:hypothetical protein
VWRKPSSCDSGWPADGKIERFFNYVFGKSRGAMNYGQADKWLRAIGGTSDVVRDADGNDFVVVSVDSATKGGVSRRMAVDASTGVERPGAIRRAFVRACEELKWALG